MSEKLLKVTDLSVAVGEGEEASEILHHVSLSVKPGEVHVLMGPNGAGKSTLVNAIMGNPAYHVTSGRIEFDGQDITSAPADERARAGLFMSFQTPLEVPGLTLMNFLRTAKEQNSGEHVRLWTFRKQVLSNMKLLDMDESYLDRDLNVGFSGGEKKKAEMLQLLTLNPRLAILDETDSGLDIDAVRTVSDGIGQFMSQGDRSLIVITHITRILDALKVSYTHVLVNGTLVKTGDGSLVSKINEEGFEAYEQKK